MAEQAHHLDEVGRLAALLLDGGLNLEDRRRLEQMLSSDEESLSYYENYVEIHSLLHWQHGLAEKRETGFLQSCSPCASCPPVSTFPTIALFDGAIDTATIYFSSGWPVAYLAATVIFGIGLLIGSHVYVSQPVQVARQSVPLPSPLSPLPSIVGRITGMVDCQFDQRSEISGPKTQDPRPKTLVSLGDKFALASGLMEITYDTGAKVILHGPVTYEVESKNGGFMAIGRVTGKVEVETAKGFSVRTPVATVTDLGTEFGVEVDRQGQTTAHVFRGAVNLQAIAIDGKLSAITRVLHENESARVEKSSVGRSDLARVTIVGVAAPVGFVREIPRLSIKTLDLVDVMAGGDGFSGRRNKGIDPLSGRTVDSLLGKGIAQLSGDGQYHRVAGRPLVDGVFVPNGGKNAVQVDSAGHACDEFPGTANTTWQYIWAGGQLRDEGVPTKLDDVDYASPGHGLLYFNGNSAITFDLEAIRRANPGCKLLRFRAAAGNTEPAEFDSYADFWVLVDGQSRFRRRQIRSSDGAYSVAVPIGQSDRFLTLAATDGGDGIRHDWIIFGDPRLELLPAALSAGSPPEQGAAEH